MYRMDWTDERMDDFVKQVDQRFKQVDQRFDRVDAEMRGLRDEMKAGFAKIDERFEAMQRLLLQSSVLVIVALIGLIATQL